MSLSTVILALHFRLGCWYLLCQHQVLQKFERKKQSLELVLHLQPAPFPWASSLGFLQLFEKEAQDWLWCQSHQILCQGYDGPCDETCVGASLARIWIWFAIAALLGTATFFLGTKRKLQMEILFLVLPSHMGAGEKIACRRDWQLEDAQGNTHVHWAWYQQGYWGCSCWSSLWSSSRGLSQRTELSGTWEILYMYSFTCLCCCTKKGGMQLPVRLDCDQQQHLHPHCPIASAPPKSCFGKLFVATVVARVWF